MTDRYQEWRNFYAKHVSSWMSLEELRAECGKLTTADAPSPEALLIHAMHALEGCEQRAAPINDDGSCICTELLKRGWRQCAVGQKTTQYCQMAEDVRRELREVYSALGDIRVDNVATLPEAVCRLREAAVVLYEAMSETERSRLHAAFPEQMKWLSGLTLVLE